MRKIKMMSRADMVKGHGVLSAGQEQIGLIQDMKEEFMIVENGRDADITHYHTINPSLFLTIGSRKRSGKTVGYVHFLPETVENSIKLPPGIKTLFYKYMLLFYRRMDYLVTVNPYFIPRLMEYGIPREKISYIPNFVSEQSFYALDDEARKENRKGYGLDPERFTVVCAGQLQKRKGVMDFIEIARQMPDVQFAWAGGFSFGKITDGFEEIKAEMEHLPPNMFFVGMLEREDMNAFYNMGDVMFLPSYEELFPMTILESMNCGIPILVRDLDIYKPVLFDHALTGNSNEEFISQITHLMIRPEYYKEASRKSFEGHDRYSKTAVSAMWKEFYLRILTEAETVPAYGMETAKYEQTR